MAKILIFTTNTETTGGFERLSVELAVALNQLGTKTDLLSQYHQTNAENSLLNEKVNRNEIAHIYYLGLRTAPSLSAVIQAFFRFKRLIRNEKYSAIEASGFLPSIFAALGTLGTKTRVVVGIHDTKSQVPTRIIRHLIEIVVFAIASQVRFYAISQAVQHSWITYSRTHPNRTMVVYNAIHEEFFSLGQQSAMRDDYRTAYDIPVDGKVVLFVGRLMHRKGLDTLFEAVCPLLQRSTNLYLFIVGREDGTESADDLQLMARLKEYAAGAPWKNRARFLGFRSDIPKLMVASDLLVHPARIEGFGLVLAEALAVGIPIIATNVGGIPEVLDETDALLIAPGDAESLAVSIVEVLNWTNDKRAAAVKKGKRRAEAFRTNRRASEILKFLTQAE